MAGKQAAGNGFKGRSPRKNASLGTHQTGIMTANQFFALKNAEENGDEGVAGLFNEDDNEDETETSTAAMGEEDGALALSSDTQGE